jgi:hypothetical protein
MLEQLEIVYHGVPWAHPPRLLKEIQDGETSWEDALRFYFNVRSPGSTRAVDPRRWDAQAKPRDVAEGTAIGVGFDGSTSHDATVLRGCTADGYRFTLGRWSRPPGVLEWTVPRAEVDEVVAATFARYRVGKMLADPPGWRTEIERWQERYGDEVVIALDTNQARRMAPIVDRWRTGIANGEGTHDADEFVTAQVKACRLKKVHLADGDDDRTMYMLGKDGQVGNDSAVADALAYEAAMTMPPPSEPDVAEPWVIIR